MTEGMTGITLFSGGSAMPGRTHTVSVNIEELMQMQQHKNKQYNLKMNINNNKQPIETNCYGKRR